MPTPPTSSTTSGMGAIPIPGGIAFRVWAKFAPSCSVVGEFNAWNTTANPLARDGTSGFWSVDVPGAAIGQQYKFFIPGAPGKGFRIDPYARSMTKSPSGELNALIAPADTTFDAPGYHTPNWNEAVLCELHIPTFSTQADGSPGDFKTAASRLKDLADIGINAIEIMPLGEFATLTSSGYNPGYIFAIEDTYGGPDQFRDFVNAAHKLGIAVIVDVVYNHLGDTDLWQFDGWSTPAVCPFLDAAPDVHFRTDGGIFFYEDSRAHTDFSHSRFDFGREEVCDYLLDNTRRWLRDRFADGLRFDSTVNIRAVQVNGNIVAEIPDGTRLLQRINHEVQENQGWKITIAEDLQDNSIITTPLDEGGLGFRAQWDNTFYWRLRDTLTPPEDAARPVAALAAALANLGAGNAFRSVVYSENHDRCDPSQGGGARIPELIAPGNSQSWASKKRSTLAAAVILTAPGIPMLFQGQHFLEFRSFPNGGSTPAPIDWGLQKQFIGIRNLYGDLIRLRRNWHNNTRGLRGPNIHVLPVFDKMLIVHRWDAGGPGDDVAIVCNFANQGYASYAIGLPRPGLWRVRFNSDSGSYDAFFGNASSFDTQADGPPLNGMAQSGNIGIGPYTCIILSQD